MFGKVDDKTTSIKGRVFFEDVVARDGGPNWYEPVQVPQILSAPKPTTFQHYLTQDGTRDEKQLFTYINGDLTTIRGHKLYWHRWDTKRDISQVAAARQDKIIKDLQQPEPSDTQHTMINPVKAGVTFRGQIHFENLTELELGALIASLELPKGYGHRVGMGKPLGLGSIRIEACLNLFDLHKRYRSWQSSDVIEANEGFRFRTVFEETMLRHARESKETLLDDQIGLRRIARLDVLFRLLDWTGRPSNESTRYMQIEGGDAGRFPADKKGKVNEFRTRPVLPTPHAVVGVHEPCWLKESAAPCSLVIVVTDTQAVPPSMGKKPIQKGQYLEGMLILKDRKWVAIFDGDKREGFVENSTKIPVQGPLGTKAEFYIVEQSNKIGIRCRFERVLKSSGKK